MFETWIFGIFFDFFEADFELYSSNQLKVSSSLKIHVIPRKIERDVKNSFQLHF